MSFKECSPNLPQQAKKQALETKSSKPISFVDDKYRSASFSVFVFSFFMTSYEKAFKSSVLIINKYRRFTAFFSNVSAVLKKSLWSGVFCWFMHCFDKFEPISGFFLYLLMTSTDLLWSLFLFLMTSTGLLFDAFFCWSLSNSNHFNLNAAYFFKILSFSLSEMKKKEKPHLFFFSTAFHLVFSAPLDSLSSFKKKTLRWSTMTRKKKEWSCLYLLVLLWSLCFWNQIESDKS